MSWINPRNDFFPPSRPPSSWLSCYLPISSLSPWANWSEQWKKERFIIEYLIYKAKHSEIKRLVSRLHRHNDHDSVSFIFQPFLSYVPDQKNAVPTLIDCHAEADFSKAVLLVANWIKSQTCAELQSASDTRIWDISSPIISFMWHEKKMLRSQTTTRWVKPSASRAGHVVLVFHRKLWALWANLSRHTLTGALWIGTPAGLLDCLDSRGQHFVPQN